MEHDEDLLIIGPDPRTVGDDFEDRLFAARVIAARGLLPSEGHKGDMLWTGDDRPHRNDTSPEKIRELIASAVIEWRAHKNGLRVYDRVPAHDNLLTAVDMTSRYLLERGLDRDIGGVLMAERGGRFEMSRLSSGRISVISFLTREAMFSHLDNMRVSKEPLIHRKEVRSSRGAIAKAIGRLNNDFADTRARSNDAPLSSYDALRECGVLTFQSGDRSSRDGMMMAARNLAISLSDMNRILHPFGMHTSRAGDVSYIYNNATRKSMVGGLYRPHKHAIILIRTAGLAHEWLHAIDFNGNEVPASDDPETVVGFAFRRVRRETEIVQRSHVMNEEMNMDYWTRPHEVMARCFETWMDQKMAEKGIMNEHLVSLSNNKEKFKKVYAVGDAEKSAVMDIMDQMMFRLGRGMSPTSRPDDDYSPQDNDRI